MKTLDVSIIIVSWNTRDLLRDCLRSIYDQAGSTSLEVTVVDNGSSDGSAEMVKTEFPGVVLIQNAENRGFAAANNQGIKAARGRYVLLLNPDTALLNDALEKVMAFADSHSEAAVVGCRVLNLDRTLQPTCFMFPSLLNMLLSTIYLYKLFPKNRFFGRERMTWWDRNDFREVDVVTGCFMLVRRGAIEAVGLMDERFFMYGEETDWCYRFNQAGWKVMFTPTAEIIHLGGQSSKQVAVEMSLQLRAGILQFFRRNRPYATYLAACLLVALWFGVRMPVWLSKGLVCPRHRKDSFLRAGMYLGGFVRSLMGWKALSWRKDSAVPELSAQVLMSSRHQRSLC